MKRPVEGSPQAVPHESCSRWEAVARCSESRDESESLPPNGVEGREPEKVWYSFCN